jgi:hypothetical protein
MAASMSATPLLWKSGAVSTASMIGGMLKVAQRTVQEAVVGRQIGRQVADAGVEARVADVLLKVVVAIRATSLVEEIAAARGARFPKLDVVDDDELLPAGEELKRLECVELLLGRDAEVRTGTTREVLRESCGKSGLKKMFWKDVLNRAYTSAMPSSVVAAASPVATFSAGTLSPCPSSAPPHAASSKAGRTADHVDLAGLMNVFISLADFICGSSLLSKVGGGAGVDGARIAATRPSRQVIRVSARALVALRIRSIEVFAIQWRALKSSLQDANDRRTPSMTNFLRGRSMAFL